MAKKILITGPTGAGKTTLAKALAPLIGGVVIDGDDIRSSYPNPIGFTHHDREKHALHMRTICEAVTAAGTFAIASFICPTNDTRGAFGADYTVWIDAVGDRRYPGPSLWEDPLSYELRAHRGHPPEYWANIAAEELLPVFRPRLGTALFIGRYQPFHDGHKKLIEEGIKRYGQVCIACRDSDPAWPFERVRQRIDTAMLEHRGRYTVIPVPNILNVCHGREVGWGVVHIPMPAEIEAISATNIRKVAGMTGTGL